MIKTIINRGMYKDSVVLMLLTNEISAIDGVNKASIMMATPANKDIYKESGLYTKELEDASSNDMAIVLDIEDESILDKVLNKMNLFFEEQSKGSAGEAQKEITSWEEALGELEDANLALISVPGFYADSVANRAIDENLNVFLFSDNVSLEKELELKSKAKEKGLMFMGPDSGTGIINSVPIAFSNDITPGSVGIVGASGTGIQEVATIIDKLGGGVTNAIGIGGRDLREEVGGISMINAIEMLNQDDSVDVITIISKPPAEKIKNMILDYIRLLEKPVVTLFLGEKPTYHEKDIYHAYTLEEAAVLSYNLSENQDLNINPFKHSMSVSDNKSGNIKAYYSGGTLAEEAGMLMRDALEVKNYQKVDGYTFKFDGFEAMDLGDDRYTQGKPHPMIDPSIRIEKMKEAANDENTRVILFDIVLGYGSHEDMASQLKDVIKDIRKKAMQDNRKLDFVCTIVGTNKDPQNYENQREIMKELGVLVCDTNAQAVEVALGLVGREIKYIEKPINKKIESINSKQIDVTDRMMSILNDKPKIINIGLKSFYDTLSKYNCDVVQYNWKPIAGGDIELIRILDFLRDYEF